MNFINTDLFLLDKVIKRVICGTDSLHENPVSILDFRHCELKRIPKEIVKFRKCLEELELDSNMICEMSRALFQCQFLKRLSLSDNEIYTVPPWIGCLWNLRELNISKNALLDVPFHIRNCKYLHSLDLSVNPLGRMPEGVTQILGLTHLYMNDCFLDYLPANFGRLTQLIVCELRSNNIKYLPKTIIHLTSLERLDIGGNDLTELPEFFGALVSLEELWIDKNKIRKLPQSIGQLSCLEFAELSSNCLSEIPESICRLTKLRELYLHENMIARLPGEIGRLVSLNVLNLSDNCLSELPTSISGFHDLVELNLNKNQLTTLPAEINRLVNIRFLYIDSNKLTCLPKEIGFCSKLRVLSLAKNQLSNLPVEIGMCRHLRVLTVTQNLLFELPYSLTNCKLLNALWLSENQGSPLLPFQADVNEKGQKILNSYLFPQHNNHNSNGTMNNESFGHSSSFYPDVSDAESLTSSVWDAEYRKRCRVAFKLDSDYTRMQSEKPRPPPAYPKESNYARGQKLTPSHFSYSDDQFLGPKVEIYPENMVTYLVSNSSSPGKNRFPVPLMTSNGRCIIDNNGVGGANSSSSRVGSFSVAQSYNLQSANPPIHHNTNINNHNYHIAANNDHYVPPQPVPQNGSHFVTPTMPHKQTAQWNYVVTNGTTIRSSNGPNQTKSMETLVN